MNNFSHRIRNLQNITFIKISGGAGYFGGKGAPPRIKWPRGLNREVYASRYRVSVEIT